MHSEPVADRYAWTPEYQLAGGHAYYPEDISSSECPVSLLTTGEGPRARRITEQVMWADQAKNATGAAFGGPDSGQWPAWWFDAVAIIEQQRVAEHNARVEAEIASMRR